MTTPNFIEDVIYVPKLRPQRPEEQARSPFGPDEPCMTVEFFDSLNVAGYMVIDGVSEADVLAGVPLRARLFVKDAPKESVLATLPLKRYYRARVAFVDLELPKYESYREELVASICHQKIPLRGLDTPCLGTEVVDFGDQVALMTEYPMVRVFEDLEQSLRQLCVLAPDIFSFLAAVENKRVTELFGKLDVCGFIRVKSLREHILLRVVSTLSYLEVSAERDAVILSLLDGGFETSVIEYFYPVVLSRVGSSKLIAFFETLRRHRRLFVPYPFTVENGVVRYGKVMPWLLRTFPAPAIALPSCDSALAVPATKKMSHQRTLELMRSPMDVFGPQISARIEALQKYFLWLFDESPLGVTFFY